MSKKLSKIGSKQEDMLWSHLALFESCFHPQLDKERSCDTLSFQERKKKLFKTLTFKKEEESIFFSLLQLIQNTNRNFHNFLKVRIFTFVPHTWHRRTSTEQRADWNITRAAPLSFPASISAENLPHCPQCNEG
jgi:hypothetical protein